MRYGVLYGAGGPNAVRLAYRVVSRLCDAGRDVSVFPTELAPAPPPEWRRYRAPWYLPVRQWMETLDVLLLCQPVPASFVHEWYERVRIVLVDAPGRPVGGHSVATWACVREAFGSSDHADVPRHVPQRDMLWEPGCPDLCPEPRAESVLVDMTEPESYPLQLRRLDGLLRILSSLGLPVSVVAARSRLPHHTWGVLRLWRRLFRGRLSVVPPQTTTEFWKLASTHSIYFHLRRRDGLDWWCQTAAQAACAVFALPIPADSVLGESNTCGRLGDTPSVSLWERRVHEALLGDRLAQAVAAVEYARVRRAASADEFRRFLERTEDA